MNRSKYLYVLIMLSALLLAGCDQGVEETALPTLINVDDPTPTMETVATIEPTPTARSFERPTLPPTWTPTSEPASPTPTDTYTPQPTVAIQEPPPACDGFGPDTLNSAEEFQIGTAPLVAWSAVEGAELYRLLVFDNNQNEVFQRLLPETSFTIPAEVFAAPLRYGWEVQPLDAFGIQMCFGRGGLLNVRP